MKYSVVILLILMLFAFYIRMQSAFPTDAGAYLFETDPYYYMRITQFIVQDGAVPYNDDLANYPYLSSHRVNPVLSNYLIAFVYIASNTPFDAYTLGLYSSIYPPFVAAFIVLCAYVLIAGPYGPKLGLIVASLVAVAPALIEELAAWESELAPWGLFTMMLFFAAYSQLICRKDKISAIIAGFALMGVILGSKYAFLPIMVLLGYLVLQTTIDYFKKNISLKFLELNLIVLAFGLVSDIILKVYTREPINSLGLLGPVGAALAPLGFPSLVSGNSIAADVSVAVSSTVLEEQAMGNVFTLAAGVVGIPMSILFDLGLLTTQPLLVILSLGFLLAFWCAWKNNSRYSIFFALIVLPLIWIGVKMIKFLPILTLALIIGTCVILGSLIRRFPRYENIILALAVFAVVITAIPALFIAGTSLTSIDCKTMDRSPLNSMSYHLYCDKIPYYWIDAFDWIHANVPVEDTVVVWWDYGHWMNYLGQRKTVTRNDHMYPYQDLELADLLALNTSAHAVEWMNEHKARYLLLDVGLLEKWEAITYLACKKTAGTCPEIPLEESVFYRGFVQGHIEGFKQVYPYEAEHAGNLENESVYLPIRIYEVIK